MQNRKNHTLPVRIMVPSLGLLAVQVTAILTIYALREERYVYLFPPAATLSVALAVLYRYAKESRRGIYLFITMVLLAGANIISLEKTYPTLPPGEKIDSFRTGSVTARRLYRSHTILETSLIDKSRNNIKIIRGAVYLEGRSILYAGSRIGIKKPCHPLMNSSPADRNLIRRGFHCKTWLKKSQLSVLKNAKPPCRQSIRNHIMEKLSRLFSPVNAGILRGLYFGNRHSIDSKTLFHFRRSGVLHLLAASGLHVAMVATFPLLMFAFFPAGSPLRYLPALGTVVFYIWLTDLPPSLLRAGIIFSLFVVTRIIRSDREIINILFLAAIILLGFFPWEIFSAGFHLSFGATLGILIFYDRLRGAFIFLPPILRNPLAVSLAAQTIAAPVIFHVMGEATPGGLLCNLFMVPLVTICLYGSLFTVAVSLLMPSISEYPAAATDKLLDLMRLIAEILQHFSGHGSVADSPLLILVPLAPLLLLVIPRKLNGLRSALGGAILFFPLVFIYTDEKCEFIKLIQKNECRIVIRQEMSKTLLCGYLPEKDGINSIKKYLINRPLSSLHLVIPQPDWKNLKNWQAFIDSFPVTSCTIGENYDLSGTTEKFFQNLKFKNIPVNFINFPPKYAKNGDKFRESASNSIDSEGKIKYIYKIMEILSENKNNSPMGKNDHRTVLSGKI